MLSTMFKTFLLCAYVITSSWGPSYTKFKSSILSFIRWNCDSRIEFNHTSESCSWQKFEWCSWLLKIQDLRCFYSNPLERLKVNHRNGFIRSYSQCIWYFNLLFATLGFIITINYFDIVDLCFYSLWNAFRFILIGFKLSENDWDSIYSYILILWIG